MLFKPNILKDFSMPAQKVFLGDEPSSPGLKLTVAKAIVVQVRVRKVWSILFGIAIERGCGIYVDSPPLIVRGADTVINPAP